MKIKQKVKLYKSLRDITLYTHLTFISTML